LEIAAQDGEGNQPREHLIVPEGEVDSANGTFHCDAADIAAVIKEFDRQGINVVVDYNHTYAGKDIPADPSTPAAGWITKLRHEAGKGLMGLIEWTEKARELIRKKEFRYLSPSVWLNKQTGHVMCLDSAGLTHKPAIRGGLPVAASQNKDKEVHMGTTDGGVDLAPAIKEIGELLQIEECANAAPAEGLKLICGRVKAAGEKSKADAAVAGEARKALGVKDDADATVVTLAINALKQGTDAAKEWKDKFAALELRFNAREEADFFAPYVEKGVLNPTARKEEYGDFVKVYHQDPAACKRMLDGRAALLPPQGRTTPPSGGKPADDRQAIIAKASREYDEGGTKGRLTDKSGFVNFALREANLAVLTAEEGAKLAS
jgi:phage I-like protein